jgi:hypothetical protein
VSSVSPCPMGMIIFPFYCVMDATDVRLGCLRGKDQHLIKPEEFIESRRRRERCYSWLLWHDAPAG